MIAMKPIPALDEAGRRHVATLPDDPLLPDGGYEGIVSAGRGSWYAVTCHGERVGTILAGIEPTRQGDELVIIAGAADVCPVYGPLLVPTMNFVRQRLAQWLGCKTVRFHTARPAMGRVLGDVWQPVETVYRSIV